MVTFNVHGKEYKVVFGYGLLTKTDVLDKVQGITDGKERSLQKMISLLPELLLAGLQKKHKEEFGYESDSEKEAALDKVCDLLDDYEDEGTEENPKSGFDLYQLLDKELEKMVFIRSAECSSRSTGSREECNEASTGSQKEKLTFREAVYQEILPLYLSIGVSKEEFMDSTPAELKPYLEAEKIRQKRKDAELWQAGIYETSATFTAVANALMGKKSKAEYLKKPLLESAEEEKRKQEGILSEEEKKKQRNALLASLQLMQANFELNHEKGRQDE